MDDLPEIEYEKFGINCNDHSVLGRFLATRPAEQVALLACKKLMKPEHYRAMLDENRISIPIAEKFSLDIRFGVDGYYFVPRLNVILVERGPNFDYDCYFCVGPALSMPFFDNILAYYLLFTTKGGRRHFAKKANPLGAFAPNAEQMNVIWNAMKAGAV